MINLLGSILLNKLINFDNYDLSKKILINLNILSNTIDILVDLGDHICSFYICNNVQKFCNNHRIIDYNWYQLLIKYNELISRNINFDIYLNWSEIGPYIYI